MSGEITRLLAASRDGNAEAQEALLERIYHDLRGIAARQLSSESRRLTLSATMLVNETYLRLLGERQQDFADRAHFFRLAARTMRRIAVDAARSRLAAKRGGGVQPSELNPEQVPASDRAAAILEVDSLLSSLQDERLVDVVQCRFFMGMTETETAEALGVSRPTVARAWAEARQQLAAHLRGG